MTAVTMTAIAQVDVVDQIVQDIELWEAKARLTLWRTFVAAGKRVFALAVPLTLKIGLE